VVADVLRLGGGYRRGARKCRAGQADGDEAD
jgi:hypothetical protein